MVATMDLLCEEINHLSRGNYPSERMLVFSSVILQFDNQVKKIRDVIRTIECQMNLWVSNKFDLLVQEAIRCDRTPGRRPRRSTNDEHTQKVFGRLMLQGKICAAMWWISERSKGSVLSPSDDVTVTVSGKKQSVPVTEALKQKHPHSHPPHSSTLLEPSSLPLLEDIEVTGNHVSLIAHCIKGSAGPGGCDSSHWQDALLCFGLHSRKLCDAVATLTRQFANSLVNW